MAAPPSLQLGETQDPTALIPGNVSVVWDNITGLSDARTLITDAHAACEAITSEEALESGVTSLFYGMDRSKQLSRYEGFAAILETAHGALTTYAGALSTAQGVAADALAKWNEGEQMTQDAITQYNAAVDAYNAAQCAPKKYTFAGGRAYEVPTISQGPPGEFVDPGESVRQEAKALLESGRKDLLTAAGKALATLGAPDEEDDGKENSHSGDVDWLGAQGSMEGPSISWSFWEKHFGDSEPGDDDPFKISLGSIEGGVYVFNAEGEFENYYGDVKVNGDGSVTILGADGSAGATIDRDGVKINADGTLTILGAEGSIHGSLGPAEIGAEGEVLVGATAEGDLSLTKEGIHGGGELFAGGKIEGKINGDVGGVGAEGRGEGWAGIGIAGDADLTFKDGKLTVGADGGVALLLGGKLGGEVTLDLPEIYGHGKDVYDWLVPG
ncbi:hypothetical protein BH09ACT12_BH09ACT12_17980 [soil metagenome]